MTDPAPSSLAFDWNLLPTLTADLPGTGGRIRELEEDFQVDEVPLYLPSGEGDDLYIRLEKRGHNTNHVVKELATQLGLDLKKIGVAGLKDRRAVTTQWISLPAKAERRLEAFAMEGVRILEVSRHTNRLGIGHLLGNRFRIRVRGAPGGAALARTVMQRLEGGVPNYFGPQRFGIGGKNAEEGLRLVRSNLRGRGSIPLKRFLVSSLQSAVFNAYLAERLRLGLFDALLEGDMAKKHDTGGVFRVEDAALESERARRGEISATGTLFGRKVRPLDGAAGELERRVLESFGLTLEDFASRKGDRRIVRVFLEGVGVEEAEDGFVLSFLLPRGAFATSVLREVMKTEVDREPGEPDEELSE
ncbi:tRNA pseudouridine13 synthase [Deinobacterium chartae]|uniref:tRNA pseudouridine synthase D n=1 Tax=Deinobacterium chartae TaxID=521158 RepID=A0A841HVE8_9DEIO|nr:tRNA pseudouridine(13) synthase TruD [Deinobacterium chartae]MBB6096896.1 tRNA pseudouridine13 synthase [Deinobacterium chartae]